jgi:hypothetical protein
VRKITERKLSKNPYGKGRPTWGLCRPDGTIIIDPRLRPQDFLDTLIHELLHREIGDLSEDCVLGTATILAQELYKKGFRRVLDV